MTVAPHTLIDTLQGPIMAKDTKVGTLVRTMHHLNGRWDNWPVTHVSEAKNNVWTLEMQDGRTLDFAANHRFYTSYGWVELQQLKHGDYIRGTHPGLVAKIHEKSRNSSVIEITVDGPSTYETSGLLSHNIKNVEP